MKTLKLKKNDIITVNHRMGRHDAGTYQVQDVFEHDEFDTVFLAQVLKSGHVSQNKDRQLIMNTHKNWKAPSLATVDSAIKRGAITL